MILWSGKIVVGVDREGLDDGQIEAIVEELDIRTAPLQAELEKQLKAMNKKLGVNVVADVSGADYEGFDQTPPALRAQPKEEQTK